MRCSSEASNTPKHQNARGSCRPGFVWSASNASEHGRICRFNLQWCSGFFDGFCTIQCNLVTDKPAIFWNIFVLELIASCGAHVSTEIKFVRKGSQRSTVRLGNLLAIPSFRCMSWFSFQYAKYTMSMPRFVLSAARQ